jgi:hypothetical protein
LVRYIGSPQNTAPPVSVDASGQVPQGQI